DQFLEAAAAARTSEAVDNVARLLWRAHAERQITAADVDAVSEALVARRAAISGKGPQPQPKALLDAPRGPGCASRPSPRREKMFGMGRPRALDRNAKVRIMHWARCLSRRTEK